MNESVAFGPDLLRGYEGKLKHIKELVPAGTVVSITYLAGETLDARVAAAAEVRRIGFEPMPHVSARRIGSSDELQHFLARLSHEAGVHRLFVVAGDFEQSAGPFEDALAVIRHGRLKEHGVRRVGIGGYPEGHPNIPDAQLWQALIDKTRALDDLGLECEIITQFSFDPEPVLKWLERLRAAGVTAPVRVGLPGPANVGTLLRFATRCGVGASAKVMAKYGVSIARVLTTAGPDVLAQSLGEGHDPQIHGALGAHLYPFGGLIKAAEWASAYSTKTTG